MHTRRLAALLIGGWFIGTVLVWFVTTQNLLHVEHLLSTPPPEMRQDIESSAAARVLRYHAHEVNRRIAETWNLLELGIAAALLAASFLTAHRSRTAMIGAALLTVIASAGALYVTPEMNELARSLDLASSGDLPDKSAEHATVRSLHRVLDVLQLFLASIVAVRLLFDFYEFRRKFTRDTSGAGLRRHRSSHEAKRPAEPDTASG